MHESRDGTAYTYKLVKMTREQCDVVHTLEQVYTGTFEGEHLRGLVDSFDAATPYPVDAVMSAASRSSEIIALSVLRALGEDGGFNG